ncbi:MAG: AAA family ATPase, partial [Aeromicrobium sp.]
MQLHRLTFQAIGPFPGVHTIDFTGLGASGLFLLEGPTGAGKSTIIDAIVFALYGGLAGQDSSKQRLHSHHAAEGVVPFVDLIFSTQSGDFRVHRTPAHTRMRKDGKGTTEKNESATLSRLASLDDPAVKTELAVGARDTGIEIADLIGLNRAQFLQTVVLPQGEFARFLRAGGEARKDLLQSIFRTDVYEEITAELVARRRESGQNIAAAKADTGNALASFRTASQHEFNEGEFNTDDLEAAAELSVEVDASIAAQAAEVRALEGEADDALVAAQSGEAHQKRLQELLDLRSSLIHRRDAADAISHAIADLRARLDTARRATGVSRLISGLNGSRRLAADAMATVESAEVEHGGTAKETCIESLVVERDHLATEITQLNQLLIVESALPDRRQTIQVLQGQTVALAGQIDDLTGRLIDAPRIIKALQKDVHEREMAVERISPCREKLQRALTSLEAAHEVTDLLVELDTFETWVKSCAIKAHGANNQLAHLRKRRIEGYAGVLAKD